ncbi:MAG: hypothetical protein AAF639_39535 [Chloroflexota bacterium]
MKTTNNPQVLVLWGANFDEQMAVTWISALRQSGLWVKVVGLRGHRVDGVYGVALIPDMTLSQALPLAKSVQCIVVPCHVPYLYSLDNDPRVRLLLQAASQQQVQIIVGNADPENVMRLVQPDYFVKPFSSKSQ